MYCVLLSFTSLITLHCIQGGLPSSYDYGLKIRISLACGAVTTSSAVRLTLPAFLRARNEYHQKEWEVPGRVCIEFVPAVIKL